MQGKAIILAHTSTEAMQAEMEDSLSLVVDEDGTRVQAEMGDSLSLVVDEDGTRVQAAKAAEEALCLWKGWKKDSSTSQALHHNVVFPSKHPLCSTSDNDVATVYLARVPIRFARSAIK